ncbi:MAG: DEAD/DEAH box helicase [Thermodesulfobacteriota bacterium]
MILRPYQIEAEKKVFDYLHRHPDRHPCVGMPTGSGKTIVIADIVEKTIKKWPTTNVLILSHVKEILKQNYDTIADHTLLQVGMFSSGLKSKQIEQVTIAGIQSVWKHPEYFSKFKFVIIDEAHLIPYKDTGMYRSFFRGLDDPRYLGLTATPYRLGGGYIYSREDDTLFDNMVYDLTYMEAFNKLIEDGYLCKLRTKKTKLTFDTKGLHTSMGDFKNNEMSERFDQEKITDLAITEVLEAGKDYKKWLIFAIDIAHAEHITERLIQGGAKASIVHSKMKEGQRDKIIGMYKDGSLRAIVNVNILTTGFDSPDIDLIVLLRPTHSPVFHVQSIGRGLRISAGKSHCLVLDFAGNTERLGSINDVRVHKKRKTDKTGDPITKRCPSCDMIHHPTVKVCDNCGHEFEFKTLLQYGSTGKAVIATTKKSWWDVSDITYSLHTKKNSPTSVKVSYVCGIRRFSEWICVEHTGWAKSKADHWVKRRMTGSIFPDTAVQLMEISNQLETPVSIEVDERGKYPSVVGVKFETK